jgi:hypothetical protein
MAARCAANRARRRRRRRASILTPPLQTLFPLSPTAMAALRQGGGLLSPSHAAANQRILERATALRACVRGPCSGSASQVSRAAMSSGGACLRASAAARPTARHPTPSPRAEVTGGETRKAVQRRRGIRPLPAGGGKGAARSASVRGTPRRRSRSCGAHSGGAGRHPVWAARVETGRGAVAVGHAVLGGGAMHQPDSC